MKLKKILIPIAILLLSALATAALVRTRPQVETREVVTPAPLVRAMTVDRRDVALDVRAQGTVLPRTETTLVAQVAGEIVAVSPRFEVGRFFERGEVLVELDPRDYQVAVRRARAQVAQATLQVDQQQAEAAVAAEEWSALGQGEPSPLVLRQPQVAQARSALAAAEAELEKAELDLERTKIRAPFAGRVRGKRVDLGQFVGPGTALVTIHATDYAEVRLPVPDDQLAYLELPFAYRNTGSGKVGPAVVLSGRFGGETHAWRGRIVRTEGELDPKSRMLNLVARVEDPYDRSASDPERPPLAVGMFVEAEIAGRAAAGVVVLPRSAIRPGREPQVLVVDGEDRLRFRDVEVLRLDGEEAVIAAGLEAGERVCVSTLDVVTDGMRVRTVDAEEGRS